MANVSFDSVKDYTGNSTGATNSNVKFFPSLKSGEEVVVRFPYTNSTEFEIKTVHTVAVGNGTRKVNCLRTGYEPLENCPLCAHGREVQGKFGPIKTNVCTTRFFAKVITYTKNEQGQIIATPTIWDRPISFAQELNNLINEYGPLTDAVFKIKRNGSGKDTTYSIMYANPQIYKNEFYPNIMSEYDNYNVLGTMLMDKSFDELTAYNTTGTFPAKVPDNRTTSTVTTPPTNSSEELPFTGGITNVDMNSPLEVPTIPTNTASMQRPVRYY